MMASVSVATTSNGRSILSKTFHSLESISDVFSRLIHSLGVSPDLTFEDILSLDDPNLLPHPALALVLVFPTSTAYEDHKAKEKAMRQEYAGSSEEKAILWFKQTINNACGLYGALHAISNVTDGSLIGGFNVAVIIVNIPS